jgi:small subunit ribosomal protein S1
MEDGVDGLIHISRLGQGRKIQNVREVLQPGEYVTVTVEKIDLEKRRISLVPAAQNNEGEDVPSRHIEKPVAGGLGTLGDLMAAKGKGKNRKKR